MTEGLFKAFLEYLKLLAVIVGKMFLFLFNVFLRYPFHCCLGFLFAFIASFIFPNLTLGYLIVSFCIGVITAVIFRTKTFPRFGSNSNKRAIGSGQATARWADQFDIQNMGLFDSEGLILGKTVKNSQHRLSSVFSKKKHLPFLRFNQDLKNCEGNLLTVAPPGAGKGVGVVIPNLLIYPGSVIVIDPKGENYAVTGLARKRMGQGVFCLDPFNICSGKNKAKLNPLDLLDPHSDNLIDDARTFADSLILRSKTESGGNEKYFNDEAVTILTGFIMYVVCEFPEELKHLGEVRRLITLPSDDLEITLNLMESSPFAHGIIARSATSFKQLPETTAASVLSTVKSNTAFLDSPSVIKSLSRSNFDIRDIKKNGEYISLYLILPTDKLSAYSRLLRLWIGTAIRTIISVQGKPKYRVLFLLDEMAQLGRMESLREAISILRGYGATFWTILQDLSQIKALYPNDEWQPFVSSSIVQQYFGVADLDTAKYVSEKLGKATVEVTSSNTGTSRSHGFDGSDSSSKGVTKTEQLRDLLQPNEVMRMKPNEQIIFIKGHDPIMASKIEYYVEPYFQEMSSSNPQMESV